MSATSPSPTLAPKALRHRRSARRLTAGQLSDLRQAIAAAQGICDERGYQLWAGVHGLPLPSYCAHESELFLPWHRAYLYFFEKALQERVTGVTLPWWDWSANHAEGIPAAYARQRVGREKEPALRLADPAVRPGQPDARRGPTGNRNRPETCQRRSEVRGGAGQSATS